MSENSSSASSRPPCACLLVRNEINYSFVQHFPVRHRPADDDLEHRPLSEADREPGQQGAGPRDPVGRNRPRGQRQPLPLAAGREDLRGRVRLRSTGLSTENFEAVLPDGLLDQMGWCIYC